MANGLVAILPILIGPLQVGPAVTNIRKVLMALNMRNILARGRGVYCDQHRYRKSVRNFVLGMAWKVLLVPTGI